MKKARHFEPHKCPYRNQELPMPGVILKRKSYTDHPGDDYLEVVLVEKEDTTTSMFVVWTHNMECGGFGCGEYFQAGEYVEALKAFNERGRLRIAGGYDD